MRSRGAGCASLGAPGRSGSGIANPFIGFDTTRSWVWESWPGLALPWSRPPSVEVELPGVESVRLDSRSVHPGTRPLRSRSSGRLSSPS